MLDKPVAGKCSELFDSLPRVGRDRTAPEKAAAIAIGILVVRNSALFTPIRARQKAIRRHALQQLNERRQQLQRAPQILPACDEPVRGLNQANEIDPPIVDELQACDPAERPPQQRPRLPDLDARSVDRSRGVPAPDSDLRAQLVHRSAIERRMPATLFPWILAGTRQHFEVVADMHHIADRSVEPQWSKRIDERSDG